MANRVCPNGHVVKDKKATHCPQCGTPLPPILRQRKIWPLVLGGIALALLLLCVLIVILPSPSGGPGETASRVTRTPTAVPTPKPTATPKPLLDLTPAELRQKWDELTEVQQKDYAKSLVGKRVQWTGSVFQVGEGGRMTVDLESGATFKSIMARIRIPQEDALKYNKEQQITFQGDISKIDTFLLFTVNFENVVIIE